MRHGWVGAPVKLGSYSWSLSPKMTGTGYPILVGEPQTGHGVPSIMHEIQLRGGRFDVVGAPAPLLPYMIFGHTSRLAWTVMVGMADNADIYQETLNPENRMQYRFNGAWRKFNIRTETIRIAGGKTRKLNIYETVHGPVVSPFPFDPKTAKTDRVFTKKVAWHRTEAMLTEALFRTTMAQNISEFKKAMALITPTVHINYADSDGNIAYWHNGITPERVKGFDPRLPLPGTGEAEWTGRFLPKAHVVNPAKGFISGWNNKASHDTPDSYSADFNYTFGPYHRALWLERALTGKKNLGS
jgi:penicillin G amidase